MQREVEWNGEERESVEETRGTRGLWYYRQRWPFHYTPWFTDVFYKDPPLQLSTSSPYTGHRIEVFVW